MIIEGIHCRICGLPCAIRHLENGYVLMHLSDAVEADHTAVEDDGSYFETLPPPGAISSAPPVSVSQFSSAFAQEEFD